VGAVHEECHTLFTLKTLMYISKQGWGETRYERDNLENKIWTLTGQHENMSRDENIQQFVSVTMIFLFLSDLQHVGCFSRDSGFFRGSCAWRVPHSFHVKDADVRFKTGLGWGMVLSATFNNISVISWRIVYNTEPRT
jgi:hypothetical protein